MTYPAVLYDYQCFMSPFGGNPLYFSELANSNGTDEYCGMFPSNLKTCNVHYHEMTGNPIYSTGNIQYLNYARYYWYSDINKKRCIKELVSKKFDVFHPTYHNPYFLPYLDSKPFVMTVNDMTHEIFPYLFGDSQMIIEWKTLLMDKANHILTPSENTKNDIHNLAGIEYSKITVAPLATSLTRRCAGAPNGLPDDYILFVGNRGLYKNFTMFVQAIAPLLKQRASLRLVCAGGGSFLLHERELFQRLGITKNVLYYPVNNDLAYVYSNARLFVFPSLYEGFGIPTVEAMACGCPVACSNTSSFPEVAGKAGTYFSPTNSSSIQDAVEQLLSSEHTRNYMIALGNQQASKFCWDKTRKQTATVYRKVCE